MIAMSPDSPVGESSPGTRPSFESTPPITLARGTAGRYLGLFFSTIEVFNRWLDNPVTGGCSSPVVPWQALCPQPAA